MKFPALFILPNIERFSANAFQVQFGSSVTDLSINYGIIMSTISVCIRRNTFIFFQLKNTFVPRKYMQICKPEHSFDWSGIDRWCHYDDLNQWLACVTNFSITSYGIIIKFNYFIIFICLFLWAFLWCRNTHIQLHFFYSPLNCTMYMNSHLFAFINSFIISFICLLCG